MTYFSFLRTFLYRCIIVHIAVLICYSNSSIQILITF
nr:MAG TPA: hypothetical protein [Bacteriophage sp.]